MSFRLLCLPGSGQVAPDLPECAAPIGVEKVTIGLSLGTGVWAIFLATCHKSMFAFAGQQTELADPQVRELCGDCLKRFVRGDLINTNC